MSSVRRPFEIQGHRGARGLFPENTIEGFAAAIALGVDAIELDVAVTADDVPVVFHDVALNPAMVRGPDGVWFTEPGPDLVTLTTGELATFDVGRLRPGSDYAARFPAQIPQDGARIPRLVDVLQVAAREGVRVDAELKTLPGAPARTVSPERMAALVLAAAAEAGALEWLDLRSFDWRGLRAARRSRPEVPLTFLTEPRTEADPALWWDLPEGTNAVAAIAAEAPGATWAPEHSRLTRDDVAAAHSRGLRVAPWTVDAPNDIARLRDWGADGVCTDRPDLALALLTG